MSLIRSFTTLFLLSLISGLFGQSATQKELENRSRGRQFYEVSEIFSQRDQSKINPGYDQYLSTFRSFQINEEKLGQILKAQPDLLSLDVPGLRGGVILDLYRVQLFSGDYTLHTNTGEIIKTNGKKAFYHGVIRGKNPSLAVVSFYEHEVRIVYSDIMGNTRITMMKDGQYLLYRDDDVLDDKTFECEVVGEENINIHPDLHAGNYRVSGNCVELYFECDYDAYQKNGSSVPNTENWVTSIFNEVSILYVNEGIDLTISDIMVWTSTDPYAGLNGTSAVLNEFTSQIQANGFNGTLAHLLSTRSLGGGVAYINVLCNSSNPTAVSGNLAINVVPFPNYSWNVNVVAHEMGHNFGSPHTHACYWNGNNTQIDDCGNQYLANNGGNPGPCYDPNNPILPTATGGTIMSYCHLYGNIGINFNNGFGPQPGALIFNNYANATCNTGICAAPSCTTLLSPANNAINVDVSEDLVWDNILGAQGYRLTVGTNPGGSDIYNDVDVGGVTTIDTIVWPNATTIYVSIVPYNSMGDAMGCLEESFMTETSGVPQCTNLTSPTNGQTNVSPSADIFWAHSLGDQAGYFLTIGSTPGGTDIANNLDVGNVTTYAPGYMGYYSTIYVKITPYDVNLNPTNGCVEESFDIAPAIPGDNPCNAIPINCFSSDTGSTLGLTNYFSPAACNTPLNTAPGVWYSIVGTGDNMVISTCGAGSNYDTKLGVFSGSCQNLTCVGGNDDSSCTFDPHFSKVSFSSVPNETYYIFVTGWSVSAGNYELNVNCCVLPTANFSVYDNCPDTTFSIDVDITDIGSATSLTIVDNQGSPSQSVTNPGMITFGPYPMGTSVVLTVANDQNPNCKIVSNNLSIMACPPPNDNLCNAINIMVNAPPLDANNSYASGESNEPVPNCWLNTPPLQSVWFSFVGPGSGVTTVSTDFDTPLNDTHIAVYEGNSDCTDMTTLGQLVGCDEDGGVAGNNGWNSIIYFTGLTQGATYYIQVDGYGQATGDFKIEVTHQSCLLVDTIGGNGLGSLEYAVNCAVSGDTIVFASTLANQTIAVNGNYLDITGKDLTFIANPLDTIALTSNSVSPLVRVGQNTTMNIKGLSISSTFPNNTVLKNEGVLYLEDVTVQGIKQVDNSGTLYLKGNCRINN